MIALPSLEQAILGAALLKPSAARYAVRALTEDHFSDGRHVELFRQIARMVEAGREPDSISLWEAMCHRADGALDRAGGLDYVLGISASIVTATNLRFHVAQLDEQSADRRRKLLLDRIATGKVSVSDGARALLRLDGGGHSDDGLDGEGLANAAQNAYADARDLALAGRRFPGLDTGFDGLNRAFGGLRPGELTLLAARPSVGKSTLALQIALHVARTEGRPVAFFSLEMTETQIADRMVGLLAHTDPERQRTGTLTAAEEEDHAKALKALADLPLRSYFHDYTLAQIRARIERTHDDQGADAPALWVVDHLHKMDLSRHGERRHDQLTAAADTLARLSKDRNVHILLLSQLNRACEDRPDKRPQIADLRESGSLEEHAVNAVLLYRPGRYPDLLRKQHAQADREAMERAVELLIEKARFGPTGSEEAAWNPTLALFENAAPWTPERPEAPPSRYDHYEPEREEVY